jgi:hypothetical protein
MNEREGLGHGGHGMKEDDYSLHTYKESHFGQGLGQILGI